MTANDKKPAVLDFPWEQAAMDGGPMPDGLSLAEQCAYQAMVFLYARFRMKMIERNAGHREKLLIKRELELRQENDAFNDRLIRHHIEQTKKIELAHSAYRKERTIEAADRLSAAINGFDTQ